MVLKMDDSQLAPTGWTDSLTKPLVPKWPNTDKYGTYLNQKNHHRLVKPVKGQKRYINGMPILYIYIYIAIYHTYQTSVFNPLIHRTIVYTSQCDGAEPSHLWIPHVEDYPFYYIITCMYIIFVIYELYIAR